MPLYGPKWPLKSGNKDTFEIYDDVKDQISFYLKNLILTSPGENISDANYGVGIRSFLFEQNTPSARSRVTSRIATQISIYLPFISIENIEVSSGSQELDNQLMVKIIYGIPGDVIQKVFELDLSPDTTIGFY
jgi:phage baseplate assembly protein W